jgi:hypothetical protein
MCASRFAGCYAAHMEGYEQVFEAPELHEQLNACLSELVSGTILSCPFITACKRRHNVRVSGRTMMYYLMANRRTQLGSGWLHAGSDQWLLYDGTWERFCNIIRKLVDNFPDVADPGNGVFFWEKC